LNTINYELQHPHPNPEQRIPVSQLYNTLQLMIRGRIFQSLGPNPPRQLNDAVKAFVDAIWRGMYDEGKKEPKNDINQDFIKKCFP
jgi:hypothetical protein